MKAKAILLISFIAVAAYVVCFTGPYRFAEIPLRLDALDHLRAGASANASWSASPLDAADEYLFWWCDPSDRPLPSELERSVRIVSPTEAVVTITDFHPEDDSISAMCQRLTMRREAGVWIPVRHLAAWQGRGLFGWSTTPAS